MASLPALADVSDVTARLGRALDASETARVQALLDDASTVVRNYTRRDFTAATTTARYRPRGRKVVLPLRPVTAVTALSLVQGFGASIQVTPMSYWNWPGAGPEIYIGDQTLVINGPTIDWDTDDIYIEVTYSHGFPEVPDDVLTVVANLVVRNLLTPNGGVVDLETIGPYSTRYGSITAGGPLGLTEADRTLLNRYRSTVSHTTELRG